jgi:DNA polymerase III delta prime subunit
METYSHITRFLFISQNQEALIAPLQSRCHIIMIEPTNEKHIYEKIAEREGLDLKDITGDAMTELISLSMCSVMKFQSLMRMLYALKIAGDWKVLDVEYIQKVFDPHIWGSMQQLMVMLMRVTVN